MGTISLDTVEKEQKYEGTWELQEIYIYRDLGIS
jgi:hypothetical protein